MRKYQACVRCVLDTSDIDIEFNDNGVCNYCQSYDEEKRKLPVSRSNSSEELRKVVDTIKRRSKNKEYDCLLGLSGGVDSSYIAHLTGEFGLRPLIVHFDNGWNSELAVSNIQKLVEKLGYNLETYVIDWEEFKDLQRAFLKASVVDIELLTDHAIAVAMMRIAKTYNIHYILRGRNVATEYGMPRSWNWSKSDAKNIKAIHRKFGSKALKSYPMLGVLKRAWIKLINRFEFVDILNYIPYTKKAAIKTLSELYDWQYYGDKHYESTFTKFYQAYILPTKFGIDKRRAHLSSLIRNGEITREEALKELEKPLYDPRVFNDEKEYVLKKLGFSEQEFGEIMLAKPVPHNFYGSDMKIAETLVSIKNWVDAKILSNRPI
jgi:N-acetyl sugar amidotransferase